MRFGDSAAVPVSRAEERELLTTLLKEVSRSFYLTVRVLPKSIRRQIGLAYLLARTTDTIADTELVAVDQRLKLLQQLRERILGSGRLALGFGELSRQQDSGAERRLLEKCDASLSLIPKFSAPDQELIREVLNTIISGQELDLLRFGSASADRIVALRTKDELDDYTYRVAGCVGRFWTRMCRAHLFPKAPLNEESLLADGVRFGKGLQLVNILRDLPADLKNGRCYLPADGLKACDLAPEDLLKPANESRLRPFYDELLNLAEAHLAAGWAYTNTLPRHCVRVRLACAWPVLIGLRTIERLRRAAVLDPGQRIKISRSEVRQIMIQTVLRYPFPGAWKKLAENSPQNGEEGGQ